MITGLIHQEGITILNTYTCNERASEYMEQKLTTEIDKSTIMVGDFNIHISVIDRTSVHKIYRDVEDLNNTVN